MFAELRPVLIHLRELLLAQVQNFIPDEQADQYLPGDAELNAKLATNTDRTNMINDYMNEINTRWQPLNSEGYISKLGGDPNQQNLSRQIGRLMVDPGSGTIKPIPNLKDENDEIIGVIEAYHERFALDMTGDNSNIIGRDLMINRRSVVSEATTKLKARNAIMNLRRLDHVLTAVLSAYKAAQETGSQIAEVLAMYRAEGNLGVPCSTSSLNNNIPSAFTNEPSVVEPPHEISHLVLLLNPTPFNGQTDEYIKNYALIIWWLQLCGHDEMGRNLGSIVANWKDKFTTWSTEIWKKALGTGNPSSSRASAKKRWEDQISNLTVKRVSSKTGNSEAIVVTPSDPALLIAGALKEAIMLQRVLRSVKSFMNPPSAANPLPSPDKLKKGMSYLFYNSQGKHGLTIQFFKILLSRAIIAALESSDLRYASLRRRIKSDVSFHIRFTQLSRVKRMSDTETKKILERVWPEVEAWLRRSDNLVLLSDFIESAGGDIWGTWTEHRGNLSRYRILLDYYERVMS